MSTQTWKTQMAIKNYIKRKRACLIRISNPEKRVVKTVHTWFHLDKIRGGAYHVQKSSSQRDWVEPDEYYNPYMFLSLHLVTATGSDVIKLYDLTSICQQVWQCRITGMKLPFMRDPLLQVSHKNSRINVQLDFLQSIVSHELAEFVHQDLRFCLW